MNEALESFQSSLKLCQQRACCHHYSNITRTCHNLAVVYEKLGQIGNSIKQYETLLHLAFEFGSLDRPPTTSMDPCCFFSPAEIAPYLENLHLLQIMIGNEKEANVILESAPFYSREVACSNEEEALFSKLLGDMYLRLGSIGKAVQFFVKALRLDPCINLDPVGIDDLYIK